jgi:pilus assembly protein Flp/PilA
MAQELKSSTFNFREAASRLPFGPGHVSFFTHKEFVMNTLSTALKQFVNDEDGVTAIEYGMIAALIATALVLGIGYVTTGLETAFQFIQTQMTIS